MDRSSFMGPVIVVLALTGLALGQSNPSSNSGATDSPPVFITVQEPEKPSMKARVVRSWYMADGSRAFQVQTLISGEMLTIVETGATNKTQVSKNQPIQAVPTRIYHWGGPVCPPGVPVPPSHDTVGTIPVKAPVMPAAQELTLTNPPPPRVSGFGSRLFGKAKMECDCSPDETVTVVQNPVGVTTPITQVKSNDIKLVTTTPADDHPTDLHLPGQTVVPAKSTKVPALVSQVAAIDCVCDEVGKPKQLPNVPVTMISDKTKVADETKKPVAGEVDPKTTTVAKEKPPAVKVVYVPAPTIVNVPGAPQTTAGMAAGVVPNMDPTNAKSPHPVVDKKVGNTKINDDKTALTTKSNVTKETVTGPDGVITTRTVTVTDAKPGVQEGTSDKPRGLFKGQLIGRIFGDKSKPDEIVVAAEVPNPKSPPVVTVVKETPKDLVATKPTPAVNETPKDLVATKPTPAPTPVIKKTELAKTTDVAKPTPSVGQPTPKEILPAAPGNDTPVVKDTSSPAVKLTKSEQKKDLVSNSGTTQVVRLDPPSSPGLPQTPAPIPLTPVKGNVVPVKPADVNPITPVIAGTEKPKLATVPMADTTKPDPLVDLQNYVKIPGVEGKLITPTATKDGKSTTKPVVNRTTDLTKDKPVKPETPLGLEALKDTVKPIAADLPKSVTPIDPKTNQVASPKQSVVVPVTPAAMTATVTVPPAPKSPVPVTPVMGKVDAVQVKTVEKGATSQAQVSQTAGMSAPSGRHSILAAQAAASQVNNEGRRAPGSPPPVQISALEGNAFSPASAPQQMVYPQNNVAPVNNGYAQGSMYAPGNSGIQTTGGYGPPGYPAPQGGMPYGPPSGPYQGPVGPTGGQQMPAPGFQKCCPIPSGYANAFTQAGNSRPIPADVNNDSPNTDNAFQSFQGATLGVPVQTPCAQGGCATGNTITGIPVAQANSGYAAPGASMPSGTMTAQRTAYGDTAGSGIVPVSARIPSTLPTSPRDAVSLPELFATLNNSLYPSQREMAVERISAFSWKVYPQVAEILLHAAQTDPAPMVRVACIRVLVQQQASTPYCLQALQMVKASDKDNRVRTEADAALQSLHPVPKANDRPMAR